ncbi:HAD-IC family P-type ATPase [Enterococcus gallinarum]|uniref:HAD-IC family P-type ATPase n=1 Tax=Enterococcus gallinarum TaxID=1353 RepID=UPI00374E631D
MQTKNYQLTIEETMEKYGLKDRTGLTKKEAAQRLSEVGLNQLTTKKTPKWKLLLRQFNNMIIYILIFSALLTLLMGHLSDAIIIGTVVLVNALIGYYQEANASDALEHIKQMLSTQATVYREGTRQDIAAAEVVPGDVVFLEAGDNVPADLRIIEADNLRIQESPLTGEPDSVEKTSMPLLEDAIALAEQSNIAFASTSVTSGSGKGIVIATGQTTEIGKISFEVNRTEERKTPLMKEIDGLGKGITYVIMGVSEMAKNKQTIIKTLPAVETLGSVDVIATDKTGTLTKNEMTVKDIVLAHQQYQITGDGYQPKGEILPLSPVTEADEQELALFLEAGFEANDTVLVEEENHWGINGEPTDGSFLTLYYKKFAYPETPGYQEIAMLPFDSDYRYMAKLVQNQAGKRLLFVKGSPDKLFAMAKVYDQNFNEKSWSAKVQGLSSEGKRVVAVGYRSLTDQQTVDSLDETVFAEGVQLLGIAGIIDPPREEVIASLQEMKQAGVQVKMITGDHPLTAKAIGEKLGLAKEINVVTGSELDQMAERDFQDAVIRNQVFARTTPKNKLEIIKALQAKGKVTAMTGDGVNDAPALKRADIGVAMGISGTDVAKDSADMILTDDNFGTMASAIQEGRRIYDNIKKSILFLLPTSFAEGLIIAFTILMQNDMPLQATQLLWINMVSAITIQFAFIFEPAEKGIMQRKPRKTGNRLLNTHDIWQMAYVSVLMAVISILAYEWLLTQDVDQAVASTMMVNIVVLSKIFYLFNIRTSESAFSKASFTNPKAFLIIGVMVALQVVLTYVPFMQKAFHTANLSLTGWGIALLSGAVILLVTELDKWFRNRKEYNVSYKEIRE